MLDCKLLYDEIKDSRVRKGKLYIEGFQYEDYETLYYELLKEMIDVFDGDYDYWYENVVLPKYVNYKKKTNRKMDMYIPQERVEAGRHCIQMQLAVIKFYLYRRSSSGYKTKVEMGI